ncbi:MAG TPA: T9SS type A sorting domain-containing protein, partial [Phaeodactylibacter sp.]|nr:T9SS type A sorting domain-containing protein [Phaeodactylibacter sp.]
NIYLEFNQYYRNFNSTAKVQVTANGGPWVTVFTNDDILQNVETSAADKKYIDLSQVAGNMGEVQIRFLFTGTQYFWILDDINIYDEDPSPKSFPPRYSDSLEVYGYPYEVDSSGWVYIPNQVVVQFKASATPLQRQHLRDSLGASLKESCVCERLELWEFGAAGDTGLSGSGNSIGINEGVKGAKTSAQVDGIDLNRYNFNQMKDSITTPLGWLSDAPNGIGSAPPEALRIGVLDTGIDYKHPDLQAYIYLYDDADNCLEDDFVGWNFVDSTNNVYDDHSHGTHVSGIIVNNLKENSPNCEFRIIPYKTHDSHGAANLFDVTCATYQALADSVSVINDSWGFYGDSSIILSNAIDTVRKFDILIVAASGNDSLDLSNHPQYPACYAASNILTVGSYETPDIQHSVFSNYDPASVDILAKGREVESTVPSYYSSDGIAEKTGTSMSAPAVTAAAAIAYCAGVPHYDWVKGNVLNCAQKISFLSNKVLDGNILSYDFSCLTPTSNPSFGNAASFDIYPNPFFDRLSVMPHQKMENVQIQILDLAGQVIYQKHIYQWQPTTTEIQIPQIPTGIYLLKIQTNDYIWSYKMIKI